MDRFLLLSELWGGKKPTVLTVSCSEGVSPGLAREMMLSPEGATQCILSIGFSAAPSGLSNFAFLTPGSRPGLFSCAPIGAEK